MYQSKKPYLYGTGRRKGTAIVGVCPDYVTRLCLVAVQFRTFVVVSLFLVLESAVTLVEMCIRDSLHTSPAWAMPAFCLPFRDWGQYRRSDY